VLICVMSPAFGFGLSSATLCGECVDNPDRDESRENEYPIRI